MIMSRSYIQDRNMLADKASTCQSNKFIVYEILAIRKILVFFKEAISILFID